MDQPQNENNDLKNDGITEESAAQTNPAEQQGSSVPVTFTSSTSTEENIQPEVPASDPSLASVANELQALEAQQFDESGNPTGVTGVDPMEQIKAEAEAESVPTEPSVPPEEPVAEQPMAVEPEPITAPEISETAPAEQPVEADSQETPEPVHESASDMQPDMPAEELSTVAPASGVISDIIAPSATAAAVAEGTAGTNVITGTPEPVTTEAASAAPKETPTNEPKSKKGLLVAIVIIVTLLFGGAAVAAYMLSPAKEDTSASTSEEGTDTTLADGEQNLDTAAPGETVEAQTLDDYKAVCGGGMVTNATAFDGAGPHPIVVFEKGSDEQFAMNVLAFTDNKWSAVASDPTSGRLVACISRVAASETKLKSCPITDAATKVTVNVDYFSSDYQVEVLQAQTGESLSKFKVSSTSTLCPTTAIYDKVDPKIFATYDVAALETSLKDLVTRTVN